MHNSMSDQEYLRTRQYRDSSNFDARVYLHARFNASPIPRTQWLFEHFEFPHDARIMELGCGPGYLWPRNFDRIPPGWRITLSDFSPGMLEAARRTLGERSSRFHFAAVDAQEIPCRDESLDGVIANLMLYHVPDRPRALSEIKRVLRPGGRLYASTLSVESMRELRALVVRFVEERYPDRTSTHTGARTERDPAKSFLVEGGMEQLTAYFSQVTLSEYKEELVVPEAGPLVDYVFSGPAAASALASQREELTRFVEAQLAANGPLRITSAGGLFAAVK